MAHSLFEVSGSSSGSGSRPDMAASEELRDAELTVLGLLSGASNHTMLCRLGDADEHFAVYKPRRGERPLWDFPSGTLHLREVAAYVVSDALGWDLVPPTVLRDGPFGPGSVQQFVPHDPRRHYFTLIDEPARHPRLSQLAVFDLLINNADRKGGHVLCATDSDRLFGIDHGLAFHAEPKLRTVIWDLGGTAIAPELHDDVRRFAQALATVPDDPPSADLVTASADPPSADLVTAERHPLVALRAWLDADEWHMLRRRATLLADTDVLPSVAPDRRHSPWPPI